MANRQWSKPKAITAAILLIILIGHFSVKIVIEQDAVGNRRSLSLDAAAAVPAEEGAVRPWAADGLLPLSAPPDPPREPILFWHVAKSGGSTVKGLHDCFRRSMARGRDPAAILRERAENDGVWEHRDPIVTMRPAGTVAERFVGGAGAEGTARGRALAVFRHPVERLVSKFYYLRVATWERHYRPEWKGMDLLDWVRNVNWDNNHLVKQLTGRGRNDLLAAKRTLQRYFVVGLTSRMGESMRRFNVVMGINETKVAGCMEGYFPEDQGREEGGRRRSRPRRRRRRRQLSAASGNAFFTPGGGVVTGTRGVDNANEHPKLEEDSEAWRLLAEKNALDMELWEYILELFEEQRGVIDMYRSARM